MPATAAATSRYINRHPAFIDTNFYRTIFDLHVSSLGIGTYLGAINAAADLAYTDALIAAGEGGTRMGTDPKTSVVNKYGQSWDIPNLFIIGSSTFPTMSGFNPTLTIQALAYMSADAIVNRYRNRPGALI